MSIQEVKVTEDNANLASIWAFLDCDAILYSQMATKYITKLEVFSKRCPVAFQGYSSNFDQKLSVSRLFLQAEFTDGCEMMHKAWSGALFF